MTPSHIKDLYRVIFKSYDKPFLKEHIEKMMELDKYLPYSSTFFCVTNTQKLTFEYISKNYTACLGLDANELKTQGMRYFWSRIHPDDVDAWLSALNSLMEFTLKEIPENRRKDANYTWNFRLKNAEGIYVNIVQNTTPLVFDSEGKPIIGLAHYTVLDANIKMDITASTKLLNSKNEYETIYFNNFSQKLLNEGISNRERDIIRLLVLNNTSKQISEKLSISSHTVDTHRRNILKKLKISSTGELVGMLKMNQHWL
ncbi:LuxR C-terminal-related transcriptional regulator [Winogradskyella bathintestinalis]|uniref:LuxR C-terminal-related transcriptional regulator n=1 Tax=Winogradskyella bathintestinalis TaxID=3035208 RepID=A0ABT7ZTL2_9FLAO|nr:LuxR C-terminal-related transcriptional regulator [Winogradskyella bathintestinalis]MDN3492068.1 LuxR C-terminal-related transcriptional regulator [Winogradskyella bathintestinalis]